MEVGQEEESQKRDNDPSDKGLSDKGPNEAGDLYWEAGRAIQLFALGVVSIWGVIIGGSLPSLEALLATFLGIVPVLTTIGYTLEKLGVPPSPEKGGKSTSGNDHSGTGSE